MAEPTNKRRRWRLFVVPVCILLALPIAFYLHHSWRGIRVTIQNTGSTILRSVVLHSTDKSYPVGYIAAGDSGEATIYPTRKSHLEIEFTDVDGRSKRVNAGGYFVEGMKGTIRVSIKDGTIDEIEHKTTASD